MKRAEWPWLWDHAQQSGMLGTEATREGNEGKWSSGDGAVTFRAPEDEVSSCEFWMKGVLWTPDGRWGPFNPALSILMH